MGSNKTPSKNAWLKVTSLMSNTQSALVSPVWCGDEQNAQGGLAQAVARPRHVLGSGKAAISPRFLPLCRRDTRTAMLMLPATNPRGVAVPILLPVVVANVFTTP